MLFEQRGQAAQATRCGVSTDAAVDQVHGALFLHQAFAQQRHPTRACGNAVLGRQAVAHDQHFSGWGRLGCNGSWPMGQQQARHQAGYSEQKTSSDNQECL